MLRRAVAGPTRPPLGSSFEGPLWGASGRRRWAFETSSRLHDLVTTYNPMSLVFGEAKSGGRICKTGSGPAFALVKRARGRESPFICFHFLFRNRAFSKTCTEVSGRPLPPQRCARARRRSMSWRAAARRMASTKTDKLDGLLQNGENIYRTFPELCKSERMSVFSERETRRRFSLDRTWSLFLPTLASTCRRHQDWSRQDVAVAFRLVTYPWVRRGGVLCLQWPCGNSRYRRDTGLAACRAGTPHLRPKHALIELQQDTRNRGERTFAHGNAAVALDTKSCLDDHAPEPFGPRLWTWETGCEVSASANTRPLFARTRSTARFCRS